MKPIKQMQLALPLTGEVPERFWKVLAIRVARERLGPSGMAWTIGIRPRGYHLGYRPNGQELVSRAQGSSWEEVIRILEAQQ